MTWQQYGIEPDGNEDRLIETLRGQVPDRVPYWEYWVTSETIVRAVLGRPFRTVEDRHEFALRTGQDAFSVGFGWRPGCVYGQAADGSTHYLDGSIRTRRDVAQLTAPEISANVSELEHALEAADGSSIGVYAMMGSIFDGAYLAMGLEAFSVALYEDRSTVEALLDKLTEFYRGVAEVLARYEELRIVQINDDIARKGGLWVRPELFRELWLSRMKLITEPLRAAGKLLTFHTDGSLDHVIPLLVEIGFRAVHPVEYAANDIRQLKRRFGRQICLHGNVPTTLLCYEEPQTVADFVAGLVGDMKTGGRYICSSTTSIFEGIRPENFAAMIRAVQQHGRYNNRSDDQ